MIATSLITTYLERVPHSLSSSNSLLKKITKRGSIRLTWLECAKTHCFLKKRSEEPRGYHLQMLLGHQVPPWLQITLKWHKLEGNCSKLLNVSSLLKHLSIIAFQLKPKVLLLIKRALEKISRQVNHHLRILEKRAARLLTLLHPKNLLPHLFLCSQKFNKTKYSSILLSNRLRFRHLSFYPNLIICCKEWIRNMSRHLIILKLSKWCRVKWIINSCHLITCSHRYLRRTICIRWLRNRSPVFQISSNCSLR